MVDQNIEHIEPKSEGKCSEALIPNGEIKIMEKQIESFSMKFPKPKTLVTNEYPDNITPQPILLRNLVQEIIYPEDSSNMGKYIASTIEYIKSDKSERAKKAKEKVVQVHFHELGKKLYFINISTAGTKPYKEIAFHALVDTGAANSLIHISVVQRLGLAYKPIKMVLATASGLDKTAIKGILHLKFALKTKGGKVILCCANFIVTERLNGLQSIIGAEFLMENDFVKSISKSELLLTEGTQQHIVEVTADCGSDLRDEISPNRAIFASAKIDLTCKSCGNINGQETISPNISELISVKHSSWHIRKPELKIDYEDSSEEWHTPGSINKELESNSSESDSKWYTPEEKASEELQHLESKVKMLQEASLKLKEWSDPENQFNKIDVIDAMTDGIIDLEELAVMTHSFKQQFVEETLPPSEELFDETVELKFEILDKTISLDAADYSNCPAEWYSPMRQLLDEYHDRFSKKKTRSRNHGSI